MLWQLRHWCGQMAYNVESRVAAALVSAAESVQRLPGTARLRDPEPVRGDIPAALLHSASANAMQLTPINDHNDNDFDECWDNWDVPGSAPSDE
jgi:hypothetical protein